LKYLFIISVLLFSCKKDGTLYVETTWDDTCVSKYPMQPFSGCLYKGQSDWMNYATGQRYKGEYISSNRCILYPREFELTIKCGKKIYYKKRAKHHKIDIIIE